MDYPATKDKKATHNIPSGMGGSYSAIYTGCQETKDGIVWMQFIIKYPTKAFDGYLVWCKEEEAKAI